MLEGFLSALLLLFSLLIEETFMAALPSPWREIAVPMIFGILLMYRVSLVSGAVLMLMAAGLLYLDGMTSFDVVAAYVLATGLATLILNRVFARRSIAALAGFALAATFSFSLVRLCTQLINDAIANQPLKLGVNSLHLVFNVLASTILVVALSIPLAKLREMFGRRFIRKAHSYEIGGQV